MPPRCRRIAAIFGGLRGGLIVFFDDGRPFHRLGPGHLSDRHFCDPDIYDVRYDFSQWPLWTQSWQVQGPRKNMSILSRFQRGG